MSTRIKHSLAVLGIFGLAFTSPPDKMRIYLVGDSTMSEKQITAYPETGWGMIFSKFIDTTNTAIYNVAQNGRSTKSFSQDGLWTPVVNKLRAGDIVLIQFGHNDEIPAKKQSTTRKEFQNNLEAFVADVKAKEAIPVLITPAARRSFNAGGTLEDTHKVYSELVRKVAKKTNVNIVELDYKSQALIKNLGPERSAWLFNHLEPGQNPNYPEGKADNTHFSEFGARKMAEIVYAELKSQDPGGINGHFFKPKPKK